MGTEEVRLFAELRSLEEATSSLKSLLPEPRLEVIQLEDAVCRVLAEDVKAEIDIPHFRRAAVDGYAVRASETFGASYESPKELGVVGKVKPGQRPGCELREGSCVEVATGAAIPDGADAVVMFEYTEREAEKVWVYEAVVPGENVVERGSDLRKGETVLRKGETLTPAKLGMLAALGREKVEVWKKFRTTLIVTGDELVRPGEELDVGKVYDVNSLTLKLALRDYCEFRVERCGDDAREFEELLLKSSQRSELLLVSGGSSVGEEDYLAAVISKLGKLMIHGVAMKPGKPVLIGTIGNKPVVGVPGHPTSALSCAYALILPALKGRLGLREKPQFVRARLGKRIASAPGRLELIPVKLVENGNGVVAEPLLRGTSSTTSLGWADGFVRIRPELTLLERGEEVEVELL